MYGYGYDAYASYGYGTSYGYATDYGYSSYYSYVKPPGYQLTYPGQTVSYNYVANDDYYTVYAHENDDGSTYTRHTSLNGQTGQYARSTDMGYPSSSDESHGASSFYRLNADGSSYYESTSQSFQFYHPGEYSITDHYTLAVQRDGASTAYEAISYDHNYDHSVSITKNYHSTYTDAAGYSSYDSGSKYTYLPPSGPNYEVVTYSHGEG